MTERRHCEEGEARRGNLKYTSSTSSDNKVLNSENKILISRAKSKEYINVRLFRFTRNDGKSSLAMVTMRWSLRGAKRRGNYVITMNEVMRQPHTLI